MKHILASIACTVALASTASAQLSNYLGPGVLTGGAGNVGDRSGEQVDLRFYVSAAGTFDNGIQPVSVDSKGNLVQLNGLYGADLGIGAYGVHSWRVAQLGLDYKGDFRHYFGDSAYDSSNHKLTLGFTYQKSRRLFFDFQGLGGIYSNYLGTVPSDSPGTPTPGILNQQTLLLFDDRTYFLEGTVGMTYLFTPRLSMTVGGEGFSVNRQSDVLLGVEGYGGRVRVQYRVTRLTSIGAEYDRQHYAFPDFFGHSDINMYTVFYATQLGRLWTFSLNGGAYQVNAQGLQTVALDPAIAALLGVSSVQRTFMVENWIPAGHATLMRKFKTALLSFSYARAAVPGNGVYLTSRSEGGSVGYSYSGVQKMSFNISAGYSSLASIGQGIQPYRVLGGSTGISYNLNHAFHVVGHYDYRYQQVQLAGYKRSSYSVSAGIAWSPGTLPLSLW